MEVVEHIFDDRSCHPQKVGKGEFSYELHNGQVLASGPLDNILGGPLSNLM